KEKVDERLSRVDELSRQKATQEAEATMTATRYQALSQIDNQIAALRIKTQNLEASLQPKREEARNLASRFDEARRRSDETAQAHDRAANRTRALRLRRDLAAAFAGRFEKDARLQELLAKDSQVRSHQDQLARLREQLAEQAEITAARLKKLQKLEGEVNRSEAALNAMAAGIEVISATDPVRVGDALLAVGQSQIVT